MLSKIESSIPDPLYTSINGKRKALFGKKFPRMVCNPTRTGPGKHPPCNIGGTGLAGNLLWKPHGYWAGSDTPVTPVTH
jgi:hypothetical protein